MAISLYSGTPGSYKSYHAVKEAITWLKLGRNLITNFPLNYKKRIKRPIKGVYECVNNLDLTVDYLINFACEHHKPSMGWINFFANHRHFNFDVILITQQDRMLDRQIRGLIETEYKHRAIKNYKTLGWILNLIFHGFYACVEVWYPCKLKNGSSFGIFNKKIADCYDTMGLFVKEALTIVQVNDEVTKEQVHNDMSDLAALLRYRLWQRQQAG